MPQSSDRITKAIEHSAVARDAVITEVSAQDRCQPLADFAHAVVHALPQFLFEQTEFRTHPLGHRPPKNHEASGSGLIAYMREAQKVESLGLAVATPLSPFGRIAPELDHPRLVGMQFQVELAESLP